MFHCNGWGMPYAVTGMGGRHVVLRKVDGARDPAPGRAARRDAAVRRARRSSPRSSTPRRAGTGRIPGRDRVRIVVAGAPPPTRTIERIETELGWEFIQIYGLTETAPLLTMNRGRAEWDDALAGSSARRSSAGRARPRSACASTSSDQGEVLARRNVVLEGYWEQPEATADALDDGWFHTGDGGTIDDEHYLTISDRKKDVIISGGENVSLDRGRGLPLLAPGVAEACVIGVPDEKWGETVKALVVLQAGQRRDRGRAHRALPRAARALQVPDVGGVPCRVRRARRPASSRSSSSARRTGRDGRAR